MTENIMRRRAFLASVAAVPLAGCLRQEADTPIDANSMDQRLAKYTSFRLETDLKKLSEDQRQMLPLLMEAAQVMDRLFWIQAYGERQDLFDKIDDPQVRRYAEINYGPWDRLEGNEPFVPGVGPKPPGANFYPPEITKEEFEKAASAPGAAESLRSEYTMIRRSQSGGLEAIPYSRFFQADLAVAAEKLRQAAKRSQNEGLRRYLELRAKAFETNEYQPSDLAWLDMKDNIIDVVIGPIETYEDQLFGYKAAFEAYVLVKDQEWSKRLARYTALLPALQKGLPVPDKYKRETPGTDSDLNAYDALYYAGDCNAGSKTIAINLPNDEEVQLKKGTRRLQLKNAMRAKFDKILIPISGQLIASDQQRHVQFDAFFANTMFHEVAHGLGIKNLVDGKGTVREALQDHASAIEEGKADILGLYMVTELQKQGELGEVDLKDFYVTFLAGIFRSIRFGASSAHGRANLLRFRFFESQGAFTRDSQGMYRANFEKMRTAVQELSAKILMLQGDGNYQGVTRWYEEMGKLTPDLEADLARLNEAGIPVDIIFEQGMGLV